MNRSDERPRDRHAEGTPVSAKELEALKEHLQDMQAEIDILKETSNVLKKPRRQQSSPEQQGKGSDCWRHKGEISTAIAIIGTQICQKQLLLSEET